MGLKEWIMYNIIALLFEVQMLGELLLRRSKLAWSALLIIIVICQPLV